MVELRTLTDEDMPALRRLDDWAFGVTSDDQRWDISSATLERHRQTGAFVAGHLAGHVAAFTLGLTVPGPAVVPCAGVTWVGVSPQHRRQGLLRALMRAQLDQLHESGECVAALWAAEPGIYGRFGYGPAARRAAATVSRGLRLAGPGPADIHVQLLDVPDALDACEDVYERVRNTLPGMVTRSSQAWSAGAHDDPVTRRPWSARRCALATDAQGTPHGYAWFRTKPDWDTGSPRGTTDVAEILGVTPEASHALLDILLDLDLMATVEFWNLPLDDPLLTLSVHTERLRPRVEDQIWVRLVRLDEALAARHYAGDVDVVLEVADPFAPWNSGRWRLSADGTGATVSRSSDPADLTVDTRDLAGAYLGDGHLERAHLAGLVDEHTRGATTALSRAMRGDRAPYCAYEF